MSEAINLTYRVFRNFMAEAECITAIFAEANRNHMYTTAHLRPEKDRTDFLITD